MCRDTVLDRVVKSLHGKVKKVIPLTWIMDKRVTISFEHRFERSCRSALKSLYFSASASLRKLFERPTDI